MLRGYSTGVCAIRGYPGAALAATGGNDDAAGGDGPGLPLIYNGQEADNDRMLKFFERDPIVWREGKHAALIAKLIALKTDNRALHNGRFGAPLVEVPTDATADVFAFTRGQAGERVAVGVTAPGS